MAGQGRQDRNGMVPCSAVKPMGRVFVHYAVYVCNACRTTIHIVSPPFRGRKTHIEETWKRLRSVNTYTQAGGDGEIGTLVFPTIPKKLDG